MHRRKDLIVLFFSLALTGLIFLHLYYEIRHSLLLQSLMSLVLPQARQLRVECGDITLTTSYIQIDRLQLHLSDHFEASSDKISLNYSPVNIVAYYLHLGDLELSLHLERPQLDFYQSGADSISDRMDTLWLQKIHQWSQFWFEGDIFFNQASINLYASDRITLLNRWEFEAWIHSVKPPIIQSEIQFLQPVRSNLRMELNTQFHRLTCQTRMDTPFSLDRFFKGLIPEAYAVSGDLDQMNWQVDFPKNRHPVWNGELDCVSGLRFNFNQTEIRADSVRLLIRDNQITIPPVRFLYRDHAFHCGFVLPDLYHLNQVKIQLLSYDHPILHQSWLSAGVNGEMMLTLDPAGVDGQGLLHLHLNQTPISYQLSGNYQFDSHRLQLQISQAGTTRFPLQATGTATLGHQKNFDLNLSTSGSMAILKGIPDWIRDLSYSIDGRVYGAWNTPQLDLTVKVNHHYLDQLNLGEIQADFLGPIDHLKISAANNRNFRLNGSVRLGNKWCLDPDLRIYLSHYPLPVKLDKIGYPTINGVFSLTRSSSYQLTGDFFLTTPDELNGAARAVMQFSPSLDTISASIQSEYFHFKHENYRWDIRLKRINDSLDLQAYLDSSSFAWSMKGEDYQGSISLHYLPFRKILNVWSRIAFLNGVDGSTQGEFKINRDNGRFNLSGQCELLDMSYQYARNLYLRTGIRYHHKTISFHQVELSTENTVLAKTDSVIIAPDTLIGEIAGQGIDAYYAPLAFNWLKDRIKGNLSYTMTLAGNYKRPIIEWNVQAINGDFWFMYFDLIELTIVYRNFTLEFPHMHLEKENQYQLSGNGVVYHVFGTRKDLPEDLEHNFRFKFGLEGNLLSITPRLLPNIVRRADSRGEANFCFAGRADSLWFEEFSADITHGTLYPVMLIDKVADVQGKVTLNPQTRFFSLEYLSGKVDQTSIFVYNTDSLRQEDKSTRDLPPFFFLTGVIPYSLGYMWIRTDWIRVNIPGIMPRYDHCDVKLGPSPGLPDFLIAGPYPDAHVLGMIHGRNLEFFYPPVYDEPASDSSILDIMRYHIALVANQNVWFRNNVAQIRIEDNTRLNLVGQLIDSNFTLNGSIVFPEGKINYMGKSFDLQNSSLEFSGQDILTTVSGKAIHQYYDPELGKDQVLEIKPYFIDPISHQPVNRGRIEDIRWKLSSDRLIQMTYDDQLNDNQILSEQFGPQNNYGEYATQLVFNSVNTYFVQQYLQFLESRIKHNLPFVDFLRINPGVFGNLTSGANGDQQLSYWTLLSNSRVTLGKYITNRLFATYTGTFLSRELPYDNRNSLDMRHNFSIEFRLYKTLFLNYSYYYDTETREKDRRLQVSWHYLLPF
ncbi:MAG: translocation/assembly module TamB domain-containing protein [Candidatus Delongbacteria bacterium]|nr:translocation/assembly module TamB domain-containing protein [Candidatus Delongbacteria bacterium]